MYEVGGYVSYRSDGVCKIIDIRKENFGVVGKDTLYYVLSPVSDEKSTFFVPVDNEALVSMMRKVLSADEIIELIEKVSKREVQWIDEVKPRGVYFKQLLSDGDREELIYLVHTISTHIRAQDELGKRVYAADTNALKRAGKMLCDEFSMMIPLSNADEAIELVEKVCRGEKVR